MMKGHPYHFEIIFSIVYRAFSSELREVNFKK